MCNDKCGKCCVPHMISKTLVIIGGINWGIIGGAMLMGKTIEQGNPIHMLLGSFGNGMLESIVYVVVGLAAIMMIFGCKCKKCMSSCTPGADGKMGGNM